MALGDSAESPRYIETLPRLGYRFIAPVSAGDPEAVAEPAPQPAPAPAVPHVGYRLAHPKLLALAVVILVVGGVLWYTLWRKPPLVTESPYLNVLPDQTVRQTLEYMRRRPDEPIAKQVGLEICQRNAVKAMVSGSIASLGNRYVLTLEALNCATGGVLAGAKAEAENKERVLRALDDCTGKIRRKLGASLASIRKFGAPIEEATTGSFDALKEDAPASGSSFTWPPGTT